MPTISPPMCGFISTTTVPSKIGFIAVIDVPGCAAMSAFAMTEFNGSGWAGAGGSLTVNAVYAGTPGSPSYLVDASWPPCGAGHEAHFGTTCIPGADGYRGAWSDSLTCCPIAVAGYMEFLPNLVEGAATSDPVCPDCPPFPQMPAPGPNGPHGPPGGPHTPPTPPPHGGSGPSGGSGGSPSGGSGGPFGNHGAAPPLVLKQAFAGRHFGVAASAHG